MKYLLAPDILQPRVEILDLLHHLADLVLIRTFYFTGGANGEVELEFNVADGVTAEEEAAARSYIGRCEAEAMVT